MVALSRIDRAIHHQSELLLHRIRIQCLFHDTLKAPKLKTQSQSQSQSQPQASPKTPPTQSASSSPSPCLTTMRKQHMRSAACAVIARITPMTPSVLTSLPRPLLRATILRNTMMMMKPHRRRTLTLSTTPSTTSLYLPCPTHRHAESASQSRRTQ
jgi:hypothetical protein